MTNAELIAKIKDEIERRLIIHEDLLQKPEMSDLQEEIHAKNDTMRSILGFLSTLESEKPKKGLHGDSLRKVDNPMEWMEDNTKELTSAEGLEEEINKAMKSDICPEEISDYDFCCIARHFAQWGAEHLKK